MAEDGTADGFWARASLSDKVGSELFRKLVNGYCGQGESERVNKQVKKHRTTVRNRQSHEVTASLMELDATYKMIQLKEKKVKMNTYVECLREKILDLEEFEEQELNAANENVVFNEEDGEEVEDMEYAMDHDDLGRIALLELKNVIVEE
jgi:hypothetical protein